MTIFVFCSWPNEVHVLNCSCISNTRAPPPQHYPGYWRVHYNLCRIYWLSPWCGGLRNYVSFTLGIIQSVLCAACLWNNSFIILLAPFGAGWSRRCDVCLLFTLRHYTNGSQIRSIFWYKQSGYDENAVMSAKPCTAAKLNWRPIDLSSKHITVWNCKLYVDSNSLLVQTWFFNVLNAFRNELTSRRVNTWFNSILGRCLTSETNGAPYSRHNQN